MKTLEPFDLAGVPLRKGATLIEAGAGTGKTFTIAGLFLRLVLGQGIGIGEILAVTYTIAATAELRDRVRKRLRSALDDLRNKKSDDEIVGGFLKNSSADAIAKGIRDLDDAVQNFDEARIFTIHGFCQRVLAESAFESGALFDLEMLADAEPIIGEVARDFWRQRFYTAPPLLSCLAVVLERSPADWVKLLDCVRNHPDIRILPPAGKNDSANIGARLGKKLGEITGELKKSGSEISEILLEHKSLSRDAKKFRRDTVERMLQSLKQLAENGDVAAPGSLQAILGLCNTGIAGKLLKGKQPPEHRLFDLCEEFCALSRDFFNQLTHEFIAFARREMPLRKERLGVVTYDDLLTRVRDALAGPGGGAFAAALGAKYRAALIDEFQDTDPVQYEIFRRIFGGGGHYLYFIGDPRQAIYSFRGADVFTYREAAEKASNGFTLDTNWRSEKRLLNAVNLLFGKHPSLGGGIVYHEVHPPELPRHEFREISGGGEEARLRFRYLESEREGGEHNQTDAELLVRRAVAADIARLKAAGAKLGARELRFSDMAVLVSTNLQAAKLQQLLRERGIKSVLQTEKSVFETDEARELQLFLEGVLEPGRGHYLSTALATPLADLREEDVLQAEENDLRRQKRLEQFLDWRELWEGPGFMAMFRSVLVGEKVRERLVRLPAGERKLANFLHLAELLHQAATEQRLTPEGLRLWLIRQMQSEESSEEHQLRLESDGDGVLIATVHKSKGLEYPVVFCPFLWKAGDNPKRREILFHDPAGKIITLDLRDKSEAAEHDAATSRERFEESLRMLYVAVTRARNLCHVYAGDIKNFDDSPLARIIGAPPARASLEMLAAGSGGDIGLTVIDPAADGLVKIPLPAEIAASLHAKEFRGSIPQTRMIASFSTLTETGNEEAEADTEIDEPDATDETFAALARFDRGVRTGLFWHELLQHLDFQSPDGIAPLVVEKLASHGFGATQAGAVCAQVRNLLAAPLERGLELERISMAERISEAEFSFPIALLEPGRMRAIFSRHGLAADFSENLGRLSFRPVEGFMRGFIDLLFRFDGRFYIVDWKSNWLGNRPSDYDQPNLRSSIRRHYYFLQYHLYTLAADLFLRRRIPGYDYEKHFGGVFYIFLRGVGPSTPGRGIFRDRPGQRLISDLRDSLAGGLQ